MKKNEPRLLHPFLFAVAPIIFLFSHNISELPLFDRSTFVRLFLPSAIALGLAWALWLFLNRVVLKDRLLAGMLVSLLLFLFFGFGHAEGVYIRIVERLGGDLRYVVNGIKFGHYKFFFALWIAGGIAAIGWLMHWARTHQGLLPGLTIFLNRVAVILTLMAAIQIGWTEIQGALHPDARTNAMELPATRAGISGRPDIYYIILDSYAAADTLRASYRFDNRDFLDYLANRGFYLAGKSCSNYTSTLLSLGSSLNFEHMDFLSRTPGRESTNISLPMKMVENSRIMRFLKANGYAFVNFKTPIGPAARNRNADLEIDCNRSLIGDDFLRLLIETTLLEPFFRAYNTESQRERILCQLATLPGAASRPGIRRPVFVFAHILCPHYPYVFGRDGRPVSAEEGRLVPRKDLYINQLVFLNKLLMGMLDALLAKQGSAPVIILQGDHGPMDHPEEKTMGETLRVRTRILNAYLLPDGGATKLYASITPVNTFRVILNRYFGTTYPLLADQTFYANPNDKSLYNLREVTGIVRYDK